MKKLFTFISFIVFVAVAEAQTPQEIISRMETEMEKHEKEGMVMTIDDIVTWTDGKTKWSYNSKTNEVKISTQEENSETEGDAEMFNDITDGYDVTIDKETDKAWYLLCKKSKSNKDKDDPKKIELAIAKKTYMPISLKTKMSGVTITMRDISFGVTEKQVTFDVKNYPGVKIVDKR